MAHIPSHCKNIFLFPLNTNKAKKVSRELWFLSNDKYWLSPIMEQKLLCDRNTLWLLLKVSSPEWRHSPVNILGIQIGPLPYDCFPYHPELGPFKFFSLASIESMLSHGVFYTKIDLVILNFSSSNKFTQPLYQVQSSLLGDLGWKTFIISPNGNPHSSHIIEINQIKPLYSGKHEPAIYQFNCFLLACTVKLHFSTSCKWNRRSTSLCLVR